MGVTLARGSYYALHDVDMVPESADYSSVNSPTHMARQCSQFHYRMPYSDYFGGVLLIPASDFKLVNGFSNQYQGWGAEDDDLLIRCREKSLLISIREGKYRSLDHPRQLIPSLYQANVRRLARVKAYGHDPSLDGLSTVTASILSTSQQDGYTHIKVKL